MGVIINLLIGRISQIVLNLVLLHFIFTSSPKHAILCVGLLTANYLSRFLIKKDLDELYNKRIDEFLVEFEKNLTKESEEGTKNENSQN